VSDTDVSINEPVPSNIPGISTNYLSLASRVSYFSDRIITPELTRAMALLYVGQQARVNPATDTYLSPIVAPDELLADFPKVWMTCGECDPFVDDTVIFAARVRKAVATKLQQQEEQRQTVLRDRRYQRSVEPNEKRTDEQESMVTSESNSTATSVSGPPSPQHRGPIRQVLGRLTSSAVNMLLGKATPKTTYSEDTTSPPTDDDDDDMMMYDEFGEAYGEINQDPSSHVTVKIYAGLSHAYMQMLTMLPEAHHAATLTSHWLEEMFDEGEAARRRRRARRAALTRLMNAESTCGAPGLEMRDEDNIPDTIQLPMGAEYRFSGGQRIVYPKASPLVHRKLGETLKRSQSSKYTIGDSESEEDHEAVPVFDDPGSYQNPLNDAVMDKRRSIVDTLHASSDPRYYYQHRQQQQHYYLNDSRDEPTSAMTLNRTTPSSLDMKTSGSPPQRMNLPDHLFLSEHDIVAKRRVSLVREVYSGVDPSVLKRPPKEVVPMEEVGDEVNITRSDSLPIAD
jgi:hypothetical protein